MKSQASIELLFALGIIIILFGLMLAYSYDTRKDTRNRYRAVSELQDCLAFKNAIVGLLANPGSSITLTTNHAILIRPAVQVVESGNSTCGIPTKAVNAGTFDAGTLALSSDAKGSVTVRTT